MRHGNLSLDRSMNNIQIIDHSTGQHIELNRAQARFFFVYIMNWLNVQDARLKNGMLVSETSTYERVKEILNEIDNREKNGSNDGQT